MIAFIATIANTGRTSMVANLAWLIASAGHRVLAIDWGSEQPTLHSYLRRFVSDDESPPATLDAVLDAVELAVESPAAADRRHARRQSTTVTVTRYGLPGLAAAIDVINCGALESAPQLRLTTDGARELRAACQASGYDYVLIDLPTADGEFGSDPLSELCDVVVVSFLPRGDGPGRAERIVRTLHNVGRDRLNVVAVQSVFDLGTSSRARHDSNLVRRTFRDLLDKPEVALIEVPYRPQHAAFEAMAVLVDEPNQADTMVAAYERVATVITSGAVTQQSPVPAQVRSRYRVALGLADPTDTVWLAYAIQDRRWADWIAEQVRAAGIPVRRLPAEGAIGGPGGTIIAVFTENFADSPMHGDLVAAGADRRVIGVHVASDLPAGSDLVTTWVNLADLKPDVARRRLLAAAWVFESATPGPMALPMPRISAPTTLSRPESAPPVSTRQQLTDQPSPSQRFVGREALLERLRDMLCPLDGGPSQDGLRTVFVTGAPGVGKSELARAYAYRFAGMYERVWWIPAADRQTVRSRLAELADALNVPRSDEPAEAALAGLEHMPAETRWLLVYDNAVPEAVEGLLPNQGAGDVVITSALKLPGFISVTLHVGTLDEPDARALLRDLATGLPQLSDDDAQQLAAVLGHLPVALILGAAWLRDRNARNRRSLDVERAASAAAAALLDTFKQTSPADSTISPVDRMLDLTVSTLPDARPGSGRLAVALARMCAFMSPDGISLRLLRAESTLVELTNLAGTAGDTLRQDEVTLDRVLWTGVRFGLFEIDQSDPATLRIHRVIQNALRTTTEPATLRRAQAATLASLARYSPTGAESDPRRIEDLAEMQAHFDECGVTEINFTDPDVVRLLGPANEPNTKSWAVRRWLVGQIRYLFRLRSKESWETATSVADGVSEAWTAVFGSADELVGRLDAQRANLYRALDQHQRALEIDMRLVAIQRRELGRWHPRTLMTARGLGGDLRMLGRFEEALAEDEATWRGFTETFGDDHPETLMVAYNLAVSRQLMGRVPDALALEEIGYERRARVFGMAHRWTIQSRRALATYLGELGRYDEALRHLQGNMDTLERFHSRHEHTEELRTARIRLTMLRRKGEMPTDWISKQGAQLLERYRKRFGEESMHTPACQLSHAVDLHAEGRSLDAIELARTSVDWVDRTFGPRHPFGSAALANIALFQHGAGHIDTSLELGERVLTDLADKLDLLHPWVLTAAANQACFLASAGQADPATALLEQVRDKCLEYLGSSHPITIAAEYNLGLHQLGADAAGDGKPRWHELDIDLN